VYLHFNSQPLPEKKDLSAEIFYTVEKIRIAVYDPRIAQDYDCYQWHQMDKHLPWFSLGDDPHKSAHGTKHTLDIIHQ
jgi:hypothetical protein